jgi:DNA-directed RNA polymerase specialized sigma24 family protein
MKPDEQTSIGGTGRTFQTTQWTAIEQIKSGDDTRNRALIGDMLSAYWKPVYCYLRHKGYDNEQAKDLTQGFFHEIVLGRKLIQQADHAKGRFRTFLLTALDRYLTSAHRKQTAKKRIPRNKLIQMDDMQPPDLPDAVEGLTSEESFNYVWISQLLDEMLAEVRAECRRRGMEVHWKIFRARVLEPILEGTAPPPLAEVCKRHGIGDGIKAANMILTVKRRFQAALRRRLRQSVASEADVSEEMVELMQFLRKRRQYSR